MSRTRIVRAAVSPAGELLVRLRRQANAWTRELRAGKSGGAIASREFSKFARQWSGRKGGGSTPAKPIRTGWDRVLSRPPKPYRPRDYRAYVRQPQFASEQGMLPTRTKLPKDGVYGDVFPR